MADSEQTPSQAPKKGGNLKIIAIAGILMVLEAGAVVGFMMFTRGGSDAEASELVADQDDAEKTVEIELISTRFQNMATGRVWDWQTQIFLKVLARHESKVREVLSSRNAEIHADIAVIFRKAQHSQLKEPGLQTVTRLVSRYIQDVFGEDPEGTPYVQSVLIPQCDGYPADF